MRRGHGMRILGKAALCALAALAVQSPSARADIGLSTNLSDVVLENARPGQTYNLREVNGVAFRIKNVGDATAKVLIEALPAKEKDLRPGYAPIPDPTWVQVIPDRHTIQPKGVVFTDIILRVPDDPSLLGKHYQFVIWTHQEGTGLLSAGLESRVRFSLGKGPETLAKEKKQKQMLSFNFDVYPRTVHVVKARAGSRYNAKKEEKKSIQIINRSEEPLELILKSSPLRFPDAPPTSYELPADTGWLKFPKERVKVKPLSIVDVPFVLEIPKGNGGKKFVFNIEPSLPTGLAFSFGAKVLVTVAEEKQ